MPVQIPVRRFGRRLPAGKEPSTILVVVAVVLVLLVGLVAAKRPSDGDISHMLVEVIGP